ncbi:MAG: retinol dehydrogenase [Sandaracinaceae bacterium]|nr:retinol dehydrogenase [Sandaracinaceae bacterium]
MFVGVVLNPQARKNRRAEPDRAARLSRVLGPHGEVVETRSLDDLPDAVERLLPRATHIVSDGGDGALHWLINEVRDRLGDAEADAWPTFVPTNGGTIDFVARKAGVRGHSVEIVNRLAEAASARRPPREVSLDTLEVEAVRADGTELSRVGFALAAGGIGNRFFDKYYEDPDPGAATIVRIVAKTIGDFALSRAGLVRDSSYSDHLFRPTPARVTIDGEVVTTDVHSGLHAGSVDVNFAGVLRVFPFARDPGVIHFHAGDMRPMVIIANLPRLIAGSALQGDNLIDEPGHEMRIEAGDEILRPILDGERYTDIRALTVRAGPKIRVGQVRG